MEKNLKKILVDKINKSVWWYVTPQDINAYKKRGKFLASTYAQAEFYGRPNDVSEKVFINNPIYGCSEIEILKNLFPKNYKKLFSKVNDDASGYSYRINLDAKMFRKAKRMGYDAITLLGNNGIEYLSRNRKPHSIELNLCK